MRKIKMMVVIGLLLGGTFGIAEAQVADALTQVGRNLTKQQADQLEQTVAAKPDDLDSRTKLLGYYFLRYRKDPVNKAARTKHVLWIIANRPEEEIAGNPECSLDVISDPEAYTEAKKLWQDHVAKNPSSVPILNHAASFFLLRDRQLAEEYLKKLQTLEPTKAEWKDRLAHLYQLDAMFPKGGASGRESAVKALEQKEEAYGLAKTAEEKFYMLSDLGSLSFKAGLLDKASDYANQLLKQAPEFVGNWNYGNAIHSANTTLGLVALQQKKVQEAKKHLIDSAVHKGSPQLNSFGPSMELAKALLAAGEKDAVVAYLKLCKRFWKMGQKSLDAWISEIQTTGTTTFQQRY